MSQMTLRTALLLAVVGLTLDLPAVAEDGKHEETQSKALRSFHGEITAIGKVDRTITVRRFPVSKSFLVAIRCTITTTDKPEAALTDLRVGDKVKVKYDEEKDGLVARQIIIRGIDAEDREEAREKEMRERR